MLIASDERDYTTVMLSRTQRGKLDEGGCSGQRDGAFDRAWRWHTWEDSSLKVTAVQSGFSRDADTVLF